MSKLIIFDTETTGLNEEDRIIQIGAIISELGNPNYFEVAYNELCSSEIPIKIEAMSTHGIRQNDIKNKPSYNETKFKIRLDELNNNENYLIAHNLDFDLTMLKKEGFQNKFKLIDTLQCAKHLFEIGEEINGYKLPNHKLQTFRYMMFSHEEEETEAGKYGVEIKAHDAIGDVVILKMFLVKLFLKTKEKYQIKNSQDIFDKMVELSSTPIMLKKVTFMKKHQDKTLLEILEIDRSYLQYFYNQQCEYKTNSDSNFNKDLHYTLDMLLNNRNNSEFQDGINF